jgi:hypothetical protein
MTEARAPWNKGAIDLATQHRDCGQCGGWLPFSAFTRSKSTSTGISATCRECSYRNRREAASHVWAQCIELLGGGCATCGFDVPVTLHPEPQTTWATRFRGAGKERRTGTVARMILNLGVPDARKHFRLECANCSLRRRHGDSTCPR